MAIKHHPEWMTDECEPRVVNNLSDLIRFSLSSCKGFSGIRYWQNPQWILNNPLVSQEVKHLVNKAFIGLIKLLLIMLYHQSLSSSKHTSSNWLQSLKIHFRLWPLILLCRNISLNAFLHVCWCIGVIACLRLLGSPTMKDARLTKGCSVLP
jgi:hypothetical protein